MGETGPYYIHNFPTHSARADRISQILNSKEKFEVTDFKEAQLDLKDLRAEAVLSDLLPLIEESNAPKVTRMMRYANCVYVETWKGGELISHTL